ncbi:hypothetical protein ACYSNM_05390 [Myroides sp. LJL116]
MKKENTLLAFAALLSSSAIYAGGPSISLYGGGITIGSLLAVYLSWQRNHSVLWAILHFFFGWFYVIYYLLTKK